MNRLRNQLIFVFLAATLVPLGATLWLAASLLDHSLRYATTAELDEVSRLLGEAGREIYQRARESLKQQADSGQLRAERYEPANLAAWPLPVREFRESEAEERFLLSGPQGDRLNYFVRRGDEIHVYSQRLGGIGMSRLTEQYRKARSLVETAQDRNLRRGFLTTFILLAAAVWLVALTVLIYVANRICRPIHQLTEALSKLARGDLETRVGASRNDEIGGAIRAFNHMADQMQQSRSRLIYLTRMASWQALARKMAHEVKNSLTPIRLNMEEIVARRSSQDPFIEQAAQIVADEVNTLERRVRAFSEFAAEPPVRPGPVDVASIAEERIAFLRAAHPEVCYRTARAGEPLTALADEDLLRGILTNLIENAAQAAGPGGSVLVKTVLSEGRVCIEVHDSGPGLSALARETLFEPTISFKKAGMGLGLSIARKSALLCGGDIVLIRGELGGAGFRVILPKAAIPEGVYATR
ncbi:MAG: sensor histidine kinase [Bryobacteraceae bacterium]